MTDPEVPFLGRQALGRRDGRSGGFRLLCPGGDEEPDFVYTQRATREYFENWREQGAPHEHSKEVSAVMGRALL